MVYTCGFLYVSTSVVVIPLGLQVTVILPVYMTPHKYIAVWDLATPTYLRRFVTPTELFERLICGPGPYKFDKFRDVNFRPLIKHHCPLPDRQWKCPHNHCSFQ